MNHEILCGPSFSVLEVTLAAGERIVSEAGAMAWMDGNVKTETTTRGVAAPVAGCAATACGDFSSRGGSGGARMHRMPTPASPAPFSVTR